MLKAGLVSVKLGKEGKDGKQHPEKEDLLRLQEEAKARGVGMWRKGADPKDHLRSIDWAPNVQQLFAANKNSPLHGVIDQVRDGSTLRIECIHPSNPLKHTMVTVYLAGVACPRTPLPLSVLRQQHERKKAENPNYKEKMPTKEEAPEAFALEAQQFTETRLLNRDITLFLQGVDKSGNLFGTVDFAKGNITLRLLEQGLGKLVPWSAALTRDPAQLKAAEQAAKNAHVRMWANWSPEQDEAASSDSANGGNALQEFHGKVVSIASADSVVVEDASGKEVRVWLASVRAPRVAPRGKPGADSKDEPFAAEAKEFLRSKLIGHKVRVVPEYIRAAAADDDRAPRQFATLFQNKLSVQHTHTYAFLHSLAFFLNFPPERAVLR
jgi:staphylococcal nuclease domain-containing protein 1